MRSAFRGRTPEIKTQVVAHDACQSGGFGIPPVGIAVLLESRGFHRGDASAGLYLHSHVLREAQRHRTDTCKDNTVPDLFRFNGLVKSFKEIGPRAKPDNLDPIQGC